eukprot:4866411-Pyramimonas_sp.AAC.1
MPCAEWFTSVDGRRLPTVELKSKAFLAVASGAWYEYSSRKALRSPRRIVRVSTHLRLRV